MKRFCLLQSMALILIMVLVGCGTEKEWEKGSIQKEISVHPIEDAVPIYFFHDTACGNCDGTGEFLKVVSEQIAAYRELYPYELHMYNIFKLDDRTAAEKIFDRVGLQINEISYPAALIQGELYEGMDVIDRELLGAYLRGMESVAIYFYRTDCQECNDISIYMDRLPETVFIGTEEVPFRLISLNSREGSNGEKIRELFKEYEVPEEKQMVPFIFLKDRYLAGREEIETELMTLLEQGHGLGLKE